MAGTVWMFPGQGAQKVGMVRDIYDALEEVRDLFRRADSVLGIPVSRYVLEGPDEALRDTAIQQPALVLASIAALKALRAAALGAGWIMPRPMAAMGLSLGEYTALCAAGALSEDEALRLIRRRGELMKRAAGVRPGGMASVLGATPEAVEDACRDAALATGCVISAANYNCPGQIVIGGEAAGLARAIEILKERKTGRIVPLRVSGAFHTALMAPAAEEMRAELAAAKIGCVGFDVIANVSASPVREPDEIRAALERQMTSPVRFEQSVRELISRGADTFVEIGPGGVLTGLVRRISGDVAAVSCGTMEEIGAFVGGARRSSGAG